VLNVCAIQQQLPGSPLPPPTSAQSYGYAAAYYERENATRINRTKTGLMLLVVGFFMEWIPIANFIGALLEIIGAIMVILGRHAFGHYHARNVLWAIIVYIVGIVSTIVAVVAIVFSTIATNLGNLNSTRTTTPTFITGFSSSNFTLALVVGIAIAQVSYVLLTYALQRQTGRILLWAAYVAGVLAIIVNLYIFNDDIFLGPLPSVAPGILYGYAYYLARSRIVHGEIPQPVTQQTTPMATSSFTP
jgi:hypothetical protein